MAEPIGDAAQRRATRDEPERIDDEEPRERRAAAPAHRVERKERVDGRVPEGRQHERARDRQRADAQEAHGRPRDDRVRGRRRAR